MKRANQQTDERQQKAADRYARERGLWLERAPGGVFSPIDYIARASRRYGEPAVEVLEFKCRENTSEAYLTVWAEDRKAEALRYASKLYSCPAFFVVEWCDGEMRRIEVDDLVRASGGVPVVRSRRGRNDFRDTDLVYEVPLRCMEVILCRQNETKSS